MELLELYLSPINKSRFKVIVTRSPVGEAETESKLPFFKNRIDWRVTVLKALGANAFRTKDFQEDGEQDWMVRAGLLTEDRSAFHSDLQAHVGRELYKALFPVGSKVERALQKAITLAESRQNPTQLHIQLGFAADVVQRSRIADYPWELVHDGQRFLAQHQVTFSRYIAHDKTPPNLPAVGQVNVLLISSAAYDLENDLKPLLNQERQAVRRGLKKAQREGHIRLNELSKSTFKELRGYLTEHQSNEAPHVLHFDGHGFFGRRCKNEQCRTIHKDLKINKCKRCGISLPNPQGHLLFENDAGEPDYVSAQELGTLLQQASFGNDISQDRGITLAVLSACKSARSLASDSVFDGVAQNLINCRVPAVVAMQYLVRVDSATNFAEQFYRSLGRRNPLATAVSQGRESMGFESNQWYRPVLYLRWRSNEGGQLFAVPQAPVLPNIRQVFQQELSEQLICASSAQELLDITNIKHEILKFINESHSLESKYIKDTQSLKSAERWLEDENFRWNLALTLSKTVLKGKSLGIYKTSQAQREAKKRFEIYLYNCLEWLFDAFKGGGIAKDIYELKKHLIEHPSDFYIDALSILKNKALKELSNHINVINIIHYYIDILIEKILF